MLKSVFYSTVPDMSDGQAKKFIDTVHSDLRALSNETRRKFQPVKEVSF